MPETGYLNALKMGRLIVPKKGHLYPPLTLVNRNALRRWIPSHAPVLRLHHG